MTALDGFPFTIGANPNFVTVDPKNRFLFVGDPSLKDLSVLTINGSTGALTEIDASPYEVGEPGSIAVDPSGTHVYLTDQDNDSVEGFSLSVTGTLTPIAGSPFAIPGEVDSHPYGVIVNAAGTFAYVQDTANIYTYSVNASSGTLTLDQTTAGPSNPLWSAIAIDPRGNYLYAVGSGSNSIQTFTINASTGMLTLKGSSPLVEQKGAYTISISPTGQFAYTIENTNDLVSYALNDGVFTPVGSAHSNIYGQVIGIDPSGSFVYVPQACSNCPGAMYNVVNEFSIGSTGALTGIPGSPVMAGKTPWSIAFTTQPLAASAALSKSEIHSSQ